MAGNSELLIEIACKQALCMDYSEICFLIARVCPIVLRRQIS